MKNLKKALAVILVVALAFSMMAIASAKQVTDFSDASSIKYTEAVDLLTGLGIIQGSGGSTFDPAGTFTREQAAKIIAYVVLGSAVADKLTTSTSSFKDVAATRWSAPFIEYCAANGIINGLGDGTFNPTAPVTGSGMAKLLLTAIGYGAKGEYTGSNWEIQSLVKAQSLGILDLGINYSAAATREQVAKYVFNALTKAACGIVTYSPVTGTYSTAGSTLGAITFGLSKVSLTSNGVAAHKYTALVSGLTKVVSGIYNDDNVIYTSTNGTTITDLTTYGSGYYKAAMDDTCTYFNNGASVSTRAAADAIATVSGAVVRLIDNDFDGYVDKVLMITKTPDYVTGNITVDTAGTVTIPGVGTYAKGTVVYPADLARFDTVLKYTDSSTVPVTYIEKASAVSGTLTARNSLSQIVFAGAAHSQSELGTVNAMAGFTAYNVPATIWVDDNGNVINFLVTDASATANYFVVISAQASGYTVQANVVDMTGVSKIITVATVDGAAATSGNVSALADNFASYVANADGTYALYTASSTNTPNTAITNTAAYQGANVGNSSTIFIVPNALLVSGGVGYTVYTGVANAPLFGADTDTNAMIFNGNAKYVYVYGGTTAAIPATNNVFFVNKDVFTSYPLTATTPAYNEYSAIVNGSATTVKVLSAAVASVKTGLWSVQYNSAGFISDPDTAAIGTADTGITYAASGTVVLGGGTYTYDSNTVVYYISTLGVVTKGTIADLTADSNDTYTVTLTTSTLDAPDLLSAIYVQIVA
jgi:hypothetical protein